MNLSSRTLIAAVLSFALSGLGSSAYAGRGHEVLPPSQAQSQASAWHSSDYSRVRLIRAGVTEDGQDLVGLVFEMEEGWHTYWRSPGRLGLPPTFNWEGSTNVRGVTVRWPLPEYISFEDYETYGYEGRVILPLEISRENPDEPAQLQLAIGYAVCEHVCIPVLGFLAMSLPERERAPRVRPEFAWAVADALSRVPTTDVEAAGIDISPALLVRSLSAPRALRISISSETPFEDPRVILEGPKGLRFGRPKLVLDSTGRHLEAIVSVSRHGDDEVPFGYGLKITVTGGAMAVLQALPMSMSGDADWNELPVEEEDELHEPWLPGPDDMDRPDGEGPPR